MPKSSHAGSHADTTLKPRYQRQAKNRQALIDAARWYFESLGYELTGLRDIASYANLSTGAIFAAFPNGKAELYRAAYGHDPVTVEEGRQLRLQLAAMRQREQQVEDAFARAMKTAESHFTPEIIQALRNEIAA